MLLSKVKYQRPTRHPVILPPTAPTVCLVAGPSRQGSAAGSGTGEELPCRAISCWWSDWAQGDPAWCFKTNTHTVSRGYQRLFDKQEWLTAQQIANYFFRLATLRKTGKLTQASDINVGDQDLELLEREIRWYNLWERVKHQLTLWTRFNHRIENPRGFSGRGYL